MKKIIFTMAIMVSFINTRAQVPCNSPEYRKFDFWIGEWEVFNLKGQKAGDSKISLLLDSCIILEEWTSATIQKGLRYSGKSYNSYNRQTKNWQQFWVDNTGGSTFYNHGSLQQNKMVFQTENIRVNDSTLLTQRLTFYDLGPDKVRQHGETSTDNGQGWKTSYDLEYRRKH
jgi:hypothetical protein